VGQAISSHHIFVTTKNDTLGPDCWSMCKVSLKNVTQAQNCQIPPPPLQRQAPLNTRLLHLHYLLPSTASCFCSNILPKHDRFTCLQQCAELLVSLPAAITSCQPPGSSHICSPWLTSSTSPQGQPLLLSSPPAGPPPPPCCSLPPAALTPPPALKNRLLLPSPCCCHTPWIGSRPP
jgi:hypothetical protein